MKMQNLYFINTILFYLINLKSECVWHLPAYLCRVYANHTNKSTTNSSKTYHTTVMIFFYKSISGSFYLLLNNGTIGKL